jgi:hypothetical protein
MLHQQDGLCRIERGVGYSYTRDTDSYAYEVVVVSVKEVLAEFHYPWILLWARMMHA